MEQLHPGSQGYLYQALQDQSDTTIPFDGEKLRRKAKFSKSSSNSKVPQNCEKKRAQKKTVTFAIDPDASPKHTTAVRSPMLRRRGGGSHSKPREALPLEKATQSYSPGTIHSPHHILYHAQIRNKQPDRSPRPTPSRRIHSNASAVAPQNAPIEGNMSPVTIHETWQSCGLPMGSPLINHGDSGGKHHDLKSAAAVSSSSDHDSLEIELELSLFQASSPRPDGVVHSDCSNSGRESALYSFPQLKPVDDSTAAHDFTSSSGCDDGRLETTDISSTTGIFEFAHPEGTPKSKSRFALHGSSPDKHGITRKAELGAAARGPLSCGSSVKTTSSNPERLPSLQLTLDGNHLDKADSISSSVESSDIDTDLFSFVDLKEEFQKMLRQRMGTTDSGSSSRIKRPHPYNNLLETESNFSFVDWLKSSSDQATPGTVASSTHQNFRGPGSKRSGSLYPRRVSESSSSKDSKVEALPVDNLAARRLDTLAIVPINASAAEHTVIDRGKLEAPGRAAAEQTVGSDAHHKLKFPLTDEKQSSSQSPRATDRSRPRLKLLDLLNKSDQDRNFICETLSHISVPRRQSPPQLAYTTHNDSDDHSSTGDLKLYPLEIQSASSTPSANKLYYSMNQDCSRNWNVNSREPSVAKDQVMDLLRVLNKAFKGMIGIRSRKSGSHNQGNSQSGNKQVLAGGTSSHYRRKFAIPSSGISIYA